MSLISPVINLILLLAFTYFIGSLIISAINEAITGVFRQRPKHLEEGLKNLFFDEHWAAYISGHFLKSPFIESLLRKKEQFPAYIPAKNFAQAVVTHCSLDLGKMDASSVISAVDAAECLPEKMKLVIKGFIQEGHVRVADLEHSLEEFYNSAMQRVSGWYTRFVRRLVFYLSFAMAASLNIDTIRIVGEGLSDKEHLERAADNITSQVATMNQTGAMNVVMNGDTVRVSVQKEPVVAIDSARPFREVVGALNTATRQRVSSVEMVYANTTGYGIGYAGWEDFKNDWGYKLKRNGSGMYMEWGNFWKKLIGLLITAFALQLGSGYWFGVLNKVVSIRAAGVKPEDKKAA